MSRKPPGGGGSARGKGAGPGGPQNACAGGPVLSPQRWPVAAGHPPLGAAEVHVWAVPLGARRRTPETTRRVAASGVLRQLLGRYLRREPDTLCLVRGEHGKPRLQGGELCFNLSHAHELALIAVARGAEVGVDVEWVRPVPGAARVVGRVFPPDERAAWEALPDGERDAGLFRGWTRLEARLKALGLGVWRRDALADARLWTHELHPPAGYHAALAVVGGPRAVRCWRWPEPL